VEMAAYRAALAPYQNRSELLWQIY